MLMSIVVIVAVAIVGAIILAYLGSRVVSNKDLKEPFSSAQRIQPDLCDGSECSRRPRQMLKYRPFGPLASDGMCFYYRPADEVACDQDVNGKRFVSSEYDAPTTLDSVATPICVYDGRFRCDKAADACTWTCENVDNNCIGTVRSSSPMCGREMDGSKCVDPACETKAAQTGFCHAIADGNEPMFVKVGEHHALREYSRDPPFQMAADSHRIDLSEYIMGPADLAFSPVEPAATTRLRIDNYIATITNGRSNKMVDYVVAMDRCTLRPMGITRFVISVFELPLNEKPTPKSTCVAVDESTLSLGTLSSSGSTTFPLSKFFSYDATTRFSPWSISSDSVTIDEGPPRRVGIAVGNTGAPMQATITNASCRGNVTLTWTEPLPQPAPSPSPPADVGHCRDLSGVWLEKTYGARFIVRMDNRTLSTGGEVVGRVYLLRSTGVTNPYVEDRGTLKTVFGAVPAWPNKRDTFWFEALPDEPNNRNNSSSTGTHAVFSIDRASRKSILEFVKDDSSADARAFRQWEFEGVGKMPGCVGAFESVCSRGALRFVATRSDTPCPSPTPCVNVCDDCSGTYMDAKNAQQPKVTLTVKMDMSTGSGTVVYHWDTRVYPTGDQTFPTPLKCLGNNIFSWGGWTDGTYDSTIKKFTWNNAAGDTWEKSFIDCSGTYRDTKNVTQQHVSLTVTMNTSTGLGSVVYHWIDSLSFKIVDHAYANVEGIGDNNRFSWGGWSDGTYDSRLRKFTWKSNNNDVWEREPDRSGTYSGATSAASRQVYVYMNPKSGKGYIKDAQWGSQKFPGLIYFDRNTAALTCEHWFSRSKTTGTYSVNTIEWAVSGGAKETWTFVGKPPNPIALITTVDISGVWTEGANKVLVYFDEKSGHGSVQWLSEKKSLYDVGYIDAIYANLAATVCTTYYIDYWFEQGFHGTLDDTRQTLTWKYNTAGNLPDRIWKRSSL